MSASAGGLLPEVHLACFSRALPGEPQTLEEIVEFASQATEIRRRGLANLCALRPPDEDEATVNAMLDQSEELIDIGERIGEAAEAGDIAEPVAVPTEGDGTTVLAGSGRAFDVGHAGQPACELEWDDEFGGR